MQSKTLRPVIEHFERHGYRFELAEDRPELRSGFQCVRGVHRVRVVDCGGVLLFQVPALLYAGAEHREALLSRLAALNYQLLLTRFGCDPGGGEDRLAERPGSGSEGSFHTAPRAAEE